MSIRSSAGFDSFRKLTLAIGFLALAGGTYVAHATPATGYELSIYAATPGAVWAGLLVAMTVSIAVAFLTATAEERPSPTLSLALGALTMLAFVGLPVVRGYHYVGRYDALTHLGWARAIGDGSIAPFDLFYPAIHTTTVLVNAALGVSLARSMLYVVVVSILVFCVFVPLTVRTITDDGQAVAIAAFAAFLLLPITTISTFLSAHAMSQAIMFSALFVYLVTKYIQLDRATASFSSIGVALGIASIAAVVYHPQLVTHVLVVLLGICLVQFLARRFARGGRVAAQAPLYGQTLFLLGITLLWARNHDFFTGAIAYFLTAAVEFVLDSGGSVGGSAATQGASLSAIGASLAKVFFKLFFAQLVFSLLVGGLVLAGLVFRDSRWIADVRGEVTVFVVGLVALVPVFFAYFFAPGSSMYFRVFGLMMVFVTILGALALHVLAARLSWRPADGSGATSMLVRTTFAVGFAVLLVLSLAMVFPSPYTYNPSPHVTESSVNGYETAFSTQADGIQFVGLRDGPDRYDDAIRGNEERSWKHRDVSSDAFGAQIGDQYEEDKYLSLTRVDYEREVFAYRGLRYSSVQFDAVTTATDVDRVQSNGEFDLYYVHGNADST